MGIQIRDVLVILQSLWVYKYNRQDVLSMANFSGHSNEIVPYHDIVCRCTCVVEQTV